ncbi:nuclear transport factor 2 family protein [Sphingobium sp. CAP-1]|uniref:nuclear transport factor 2 family protein n=1 Tax=Sphingobium sp. CAP-1 TaxID=2676077 RepID=UPI0012BB2CAC|nr:nuclear transport factor 2 family protein [Sphingobium sp. CAP-1]QGP78054.1 nuclear transport factor 2 family protein [Sphingobium sp. CAP-1]
MTDAGALISLSQRVALLEAEGAVRRVVMDYFRLCDTLGPSTPMDVLGGLFTRDAVWEGKGRYRKAFGRHEGRDAIVAMLASYTEPAHFLLNGHYLSSETIEVKDGTSATGQWMMLQVSTYRDGRSDFRSAALTIDLAYEEGAWRMARFVTENIFSRDVAPWNDEADISVPQPNAEEGA